MHITLKAVAVTALLSAVSPALGAPLPAELRPARVAGAGINVVDLDAERDWYISHLAMQVVMVVGPKDKPVEYVMAMGPTPDQPMLCLLKTERPAGPNGFSRLILQVPKAKALAARLAHEGVPMREVVANLSYSVTDPEGNNIELYQPPAK